MMDLDLYEPEIWNPDYEPPAGKKRRRPSVAPARNTNKLDDVHNDLMYDFQNDCWVKNTMGTEVTSSPVVAATLGKKKKRKRSKSKKYSTPKRKQLSKKK